MSKIGRQPIKISSAKVTISGSAIEIKGPKGSFNHELPQELEVALQDNALRISIKQDDRQSRMLWGLHRALLANKVKGVEQGFEQKVTIVGLGFKAVQAGSKLTFSLGFTNKIEYEMPQGVTVEIDKSGQILMFRSSDKFLLGNVCDAVRYFRLPEPYKGTGILREGDVIIRKAGKAKSS